MSTLPKIPGRTLRRIADQAWASFMRKRFEQNQKIQAKQFREWRKLSDFPWDSETDNWKLLVPGNNW